MKQLVIILVILCSGLQLFAQQEKSLVKKGNDLYQQKKYKEAEADYRKAIEKKQNLEGNFNLGDALYKQKQFDKAGEQFTKLGEANAANKNVAAGAYHNLGNTLFENKKLEESIEAYKKSLINNPKDEETRYNLAYAQDKLKKQQQQDKNNKNNKNQDKKNQDKKNQDDKNKQDKDKKNQDNKDKQNKDQQNKDKDQQKKDQQPQPNKLSKEDAQRMLDALNNNEKQTQDKLKNKKLKGAKMQVGKDW